MNGAGTIGGHRSQAILFATLLLAVLGVAVAGCGGSSSSAGTTQAKSESAPAYGTLVDLRVPPRLLHLPLTDQRGERVDLASWPGKTVVLVPFLTLCADICPFTTGILLQVERTLRADHDLSKVEIVELTVDPHRDIPARLAAYAKLTHAGWQLVTETPAELEEKLSKWFAFTYLKVPQGNPPSIDWWTGKPLTYDIDHSDNYFVIDPSGHERVIQQAAPDFHGHLNPRIRKFLSPLGRRHYRHPVHPDWTKANLLEAIGHVMHEEIPSGAAD